jgi:hypothetical protein
MTDVNTLRFSFEAGILFRSLCLDAIQRSCWNANLNLKIEERNCFLSSVYHAEVTGNSVALMGFRDWLSTLFEYLDGING